MAIFAELSGVSQDLDFKTGETINKIILRLEGGATIRALIDDETLEHVVRLAGLKPEDPSPSPAVEEVPVISAHVRSDGAVEFGGEDVQVSAPEPFERRRPQVTRDENGYPRVHGRENTVDPGEMVGHNDLDEDGVGSL